MSLHRTRPERAARLLGSGSGLTILSVKNFSLRLSGCLVGCLASLIMVFAAPAQAVPDFTVTQSIPASGDGTFTLKNNLGPFGFNVYELVVTGLGAYANTTRPGWSAEAFFFGIDPLDCQANTGFTFGTGFCYQLTNAASGSPIGPNKQETFTFDPQFTDPTLDQSFFVLFTDRTGASFACQGTLASGCNSPVAAAIPEPAPLALMVISLVGLGAGLRRRGKGDRRNAALNALNSAQTAARKTARRLQILRRALAIGVAAAASALYGPATLAAVTSMVIDSTTSVSGTAVPYTQYKGRIFGELDAADQHNTIIQDINLAPRNANGKVTYIATFQLVTPTSPGNANGLMVYPVPNRGANAIPAAASIVTGTTYLESGWQGDRLSLCTTPYPCTSLATTYTGNQLLLEAPIAKNPDGSSITGQVYSHIANASGSTAQMVIYQNPVPWKPLSLTDPAQSTLWSLASQTTTGVDGPKTPLVLGTDWAWADCRTVPFPGTPDPTRVCLKNGFNSNLLYEMVFTAVDPLVLGVGYAATRDAISFFRRASTDANGTANPIASRISKVIATGNSQAAAYVRGFIFNGFNQDESNQIVVDGAWPQVTGRMMWLNTRFAQPDVITNLYMMADEAPVWWAPYPNLARGGPATGILSRCTATGTCPQIMETFGSLEMYAEKVSADLVGMTAVEDIPLPANVYRYYTPSVTHNGGGGGFTYNPNPNPSGGCIYPGNPNPISDTLNALQDDFFAFIMNGTPMPPSQYPKLSQGQLVAPTQAAVGFPNIPNYPYGGSQLWPVLKYNFGPLVDYANQSGIITIWPPIVEAVLPTLVPKVNADGNEEVGVASVNLQAPLGTYSGWNITANGIYKGQQCALAGSYYPFVATKAQRLAATPVDPRASLEERYGTHAGFVCVVTGAANKAVKQRFLRSADATKLINQASASNVLTTNFTPTAADANLANFLCMMAAQTTR